jgi:hypothetical protein
LRQSSAGLLASIGNNKVALHHITTTLATVNNFFGVADDLLLLRNAIIMLKHSFLTFDLIPFAQAKSVLEQIQAHLAQTPFLYLANTDPMSIYTETVLPFSCEGTNSFRLEIEALTIHKTPCVVQGGNISVEPRLRSTLDHHRRPTSLHCSK